MDFQEFKKIANKFPKEILIEVIFNDLWIGRGKKESFLNRCKWKEIDLLGEKIANNVANMPKMPKDGDVKRLMQWKEDFDKSQKEYGALNKKRDKLLKESYINE